MNLFGRLLTLVEPNYPDWFIREQDPERLIFFSDAVFAIAITLLVIDIGVPEVPATQPNAMLAEELLALLPQFVSFGLSFLAIGTFWLTHHRLFTYIESCSRRLLSLNLLFLLFVSLVPFSSALLGRYSGRRLVVIWYACHMAIAGMMLLGIWYYTTGIKDLVQPAIDTRAVQYIGRRVGAVPMVFIVSIGITFLSIRLAEASWLLLIPIHPLISLSGFDHPRRERQ